MEYLASLHVTLSDLGEASHVHVTIGNESCDLDSIACAISHAHFVAEQDDSVASLPLLQCSRSDFELRTDAVWLFSKLNLNASQLLFCEDVVGMLSRLQQVKVTLVDHALPTGTVQELPNTVVTEIIDHHVLPDITVGEGCCVVMEPVGSCATLVAEKLLGAEGYAVPTAIATLLLGAIMIDTVGLEKDRGRTTDKDKAIAERLTPLTSIPPAQLYDGLSTARFNTAGLSVRQLLRKDFKCAEAGAWRLGFSSVVCQLPELLEREGAEEDLCTFCQSQGLEALLILGVWPSADTIHRQIAIFQPARSDLADGLAGVLEADPELQCQRMQAEPCILLSQANTKCSRKYVLPLVVDFVSILAHDRIGQCEGGGGIACCHCSHTGD
jgi:exopolyphosphatase